ncbi:MAG: DUF1345 domain-containing protein [Vulcanococcus sp.]|jgi:uncharacterized membrane protein|uniref:DUF1345 domain-containing protein n=1 Tax=Vulcanococcus sp. TaxID=2856995 RepID=UPI0025DBA50B|nr:DUF1345 domain-containing protein [Vulcanococcus sp.]MBW0168194.1 DUF1345 domain-containing protein [Vulcanococcus sp.]
MDRHPVAFEDLARGLRALLFGTSVMVVGLLAQLHPAEALTLAILATMLVDLLRLVRTSLRLDAERTRQIFSTWQPNGGKLLRRTVFLAFLSVLVLSFCVHDVKSGNGVLPASLRISLFFAALFTTWLELHLSFAVYYAKVYFVGNPQPAAHGDEPQIFIFPGKDEPLFTDFLYVAYSVALTFAMSDVDLEDGFARRIVLLQAIVSFLFYSTIFSMVTNLMVS